MLGDDDKLILSFCIGLAVGPYSCDIKWLVICIIVWEIIIWGCCKEYPIGYRFLLNISYLSGWFIGNVFSAGHLNIHRDIPGYSGYSPSISNLDTPYDCDLEENDIYIKKNRHIISHLMSRNKNIKTVVKKHRPSKSLHISMKSSLQS